MIRAIIFDLDNCLAAADEPGPIILAATFAAVRAANGNTLPAERLEEALAACWRYPLDWVARQYGFSESMLASGWAANARAQVETPMHGYGDLHVLSKLPVPLFLVTSGFRRLQESKVQALGIEGRFERIYIDALDDPNREGKVNIFRSILDTYALVPGEVVVVGDSEESEIAAGNQLGLATVQILRPGVPRGNAAVHVVSSLHDLLDLLPHLAVCQARIGCHAPSIGVCQ